VFDVFGQLSATSQTVSPSVSGDVASAGQAAPEPVHCSATSHAPTAERQTVDDDANALPGHAALEPVQFSATSQMPAELRQTVLDEAKPSLGQFADEPVQLSATSQMPAELRQTVELGRKPSAGQASFVPSQFSAVSHAPAAARHSVVVGSFASAGQLVLAPSHVSAASQSPAAARQSDPALPAGCVQVPAPSQTSSVQTFASAVHGVFAGWFASAGQFAAEPSQFSTASHSPAAERQTTNAPATLSAGQP
jgi:hypothetical protein